MSGSHGCASRPGRFRLGFVLVASVGWVASGPSPARACHIRQDATPARGKATPAAPAPAGLQDLIKDWPKANPAPPPAIVPAAATAPPAAAEMLAPGPTVANSGTSQPCGCPPPPPCVVTPPAGTGTAPGTGTTPAPQALAPPSSLTEAIPTPEPSTIVSGLALLGAVAWRRRSPRRQG